MILPTFLLREFADPVSLALNTPEQAECLVSAIKPCGRSWVALDFTGIHCINPEFVLEFIRLAQLDLPDSWLVPRHYGQDCGGLTIHLVSRLKRLREIEWTNGCERFSTGIERRERQAGHE
ncbi:MAG: hypothetical protein H6R26_3027 [Proteobacteria bacterium]|nr:hypothetical protein [Pseudomonadota bacterium]